MDLYQVLVLILIQLYKGAKELTIAYHQPAQLNKELYVEKAEMFLVLFLNVE